MAKAAAVAARPVTTVQMTLARETKNTFRFEDETEGTPIPLLYVGKGAFPEGAPQSITVTVN